MQSCSSTTHGGPTTIADIKSYKPQSSSIGSGQVLQEPYPYEKAKLVVTEMADALALQNLTVTPLGEDFLLEGDLPCSPASSKK